MPDSTPTDPRDFASVLVDMPELNDKAGADMQAIIAAVRLTGKAGSLSLKIKVTKVPNTDNQLVFAVDSVPVIPRNGIKGGVFYADKQNNPRRNDPNNPGLFSDEEVRTAQRVNTETGEVKDVAERGPVKVAPADEPTKEV